MNKIAKVTEGAGGQAGEPESVMVSSGIANKVMLSELRFGRDAPGGSINVRKTALGADDAMVASVREKGIMLALAVVEVDGLYYVCDGDTRLDAALKAIQDPTDRKSYPVNVTVHPREEALEISLAAGMLHRDLHPVDEFEALAALVAEGKTVDELGRRFKMKVPQVRQALSLAAISPKIREAWRKDQIDDRAAEAFGKCQDQKAQETVFNRLVKQRGDLQAWRIEQELKVTNQDTVLLLKLVGRDRYESAGHRVNETLFSGRDGEGEPVVSDPAALKSMAYEVIDEKLKALTEDGWAWAMRRDDAPKDSHAWKRVGVPSGKYTNDQKKAMGCIVGLDYDGKLSIERGIVKPGGKVSLPKSSAGETGAGRPKKANAAGTGKVDETLSNNLMQRLSEQLSTAVSAALAADPRVGLAAILAGLASGGDTVDVRENGLERKKGRDTKPLHFERALLTYLEASQVAQLNLLAGVAGDAVDLQVLHASKAPLKDPATAALCDALDSSSTGGAVLQERIRQSFDLADYCNSVAKPLVLAAIAEAINPTEAKKLEGKPKGEVVKFAIANVKPTGWLPKELRTTAYAGPGSGKTSAPVATAQKAAAKAKAAPKKAAKPKVKKTLRKAAAAKRKR